MEPLLTLPEGLWGLYLTIGDASLRMGAALVCGAVIGLERERKQRPAGLRTHMLVALASALFTIIAFQIYADVQSLDESDTSDPLRLLEAITAGVAFLAAGTILQRQDGVHGITTGAGLWLSGALGMACGKGLFLLAFLGAILTLVVLALVRVVERTNEPKGQKER
jgi:putative Mg2+ transporter-C (MgtC) family protein